MQRGSFTPPLWTNASLYAQGVLISPFDAECKIKAPFTQPNPDPIATEYILCLIRNWLIFWLIVYRGILRDISKNGKRPQDMNANSRLFELMTQQIIFLHLHHHAFIFHCSRQSYIKGGKHNASITSNWIGKLRQWLWMVQHSPVMWFCFGFLSCIRQSSTKRRRRKGWLGWLVCRISLYEGLIKLSFDFRS